MDVVAEFLCIITFKSILYVIKYLIRNTLFSQYYSASNSEIHVVKKQ